MSRRDMIGVVVSKSGDKTVVVRVERRIQHELYKKFIRRSKKYHAHDADNRYQVGDYVRIQECAPRSRLKTWEVVEQVARG